jgi:hypothetical protein
MKSLFYPIYYFLCSQQFRSHFNMSIVFVSSDLVFYKVRLNDTIQIACNLITATAQNFHIGEDAIYFVLPAPEAKLLQYLEAGHIQFEKINVSHTFVIHMLGNLLAYHEVVQQVCFDVVNLSMFHIIMNHLSNQNVSSAALQNVTDVVDDVDVTNAVDDTDVGDDVDVVDVVDVVEEFEENYLDIPMDDDFAWIDEMIDPKTLEVPCEEYYIDETYDCIIDDILKSSGFDTIENHFDNLINELMVE